MNAHVYSINEICVRRPIFFQLSNFFNSWNDHKFHKNLREIRMTSWEIAVSGHSNFGSDQTNIVSYESWHLQLKFETSLRSLRLIVWPQEVSEVTEVKMKKIWGENPKITNFWLTETSFTPKSSLTVTELRDYITRRKNLKIIDFR